jgi:hypothetical protein
MANTGGAGPSRSPCVSAELPKAALAPFAKRRRRVQSPVSPVPDGSRRVRGTRIVRRHGTSCRPANPALSVTLRPELCLISTGDGARDANAVAHALVKTRDSSPRMIGRTGFVRVTESGTGTLVDCRSRGSGLYSVADIAPCFVPLQEPQDCSATMTVGWSLRHRASVKRALIAGT